MLNGRSRFVTSCRYAAPSSRDLDPSSVVPCIASCSNAPPTVTTLPPDSRRFARPSSPARVTQSEPENGKVVGSPGPFGALAYWALSRVQGPVSEPSNTPGTTEPGLGP